MTEPTPYQLLILTALSRKPAGSVYAGTAYGRPARRRLATVALRRRTARQDQTTARSNTARRTA